MKRLGVQTLDTNVNAINNIDSCETEKSLESEYRLEVGAST